MEEYGMMRAVDGFGQTSHHSKAPQLVKQLASHYRALSTFPI